MEIHLTPEIEAQLTRIAQHEGKTPEELILGIARSVVDDDRRHTEILQQRIAQADEGDFIEEDEMDRRFQQMLQR